MQSCGSFHAKKLQNCLFIAVSAKGQIYNFYNSSHKSFTTLTTGLNIKLGQSNFEVKF